MFRVAVDAVTAAICSPGCTSSTSGKFAGNAVLVVVAVGDLLMAMLQAAVAETSTLNVCEPNAALADEVPVTARVWEVARRPTQICVLMARASHKPYRQARRHPLRGRSGVPHRRERPERRPVALPRSTARCGSVRQLSPGGGLPTLAAPRVALARRGCPCDRDIGRVRSPLRVHSVFGHRWSFRRH